MEASYLGLWARKNCNCGHPTRHALDYISHDFTGIRQARICAPKLLKLYTAVWTRYKTGSGMPCLEEEALLERYMNQGPVDKPVSRGTIFTLV